MGIVSSGSKMVRNFVLVRGYILLLFTSISVANSMQIFLARLKEKLSHRRKISVADFVNRGDFSESKDVFCGGNFGRVGNTDVCCNRGSFEEKWREILINKQESRSGTGSSFKVFLPKQHLHESCRLLPVRGYDTSCGKSKSPVPLTA
jgi:hypothetical protein